MLIYGLDFGVTRKPQVCRVVEGQTNVACGEWTHCWRRTSWGPNFYTCLKHMLSYWDGDFEWP